MIKTKKGKIVYIIAVVLLLVFVVSLFYFRNTPIDTFIYQTSQSCNSNAFGGGNKEYNKYKFVNGELNQYKDKKNELESQNINQINCGEYASPEDYEYIELYLL